MVHKLLFKHCVLWNTLGRRIGTFRRPFPLPSASAVACHGETEPSRLNMNGSMDTSTFTGTGDRRKFAQKKCYDVLWKCRVITFDYIAIWWWEFTILATIIDRLKNEVYDKIHGKREGLSQDQWMAVKYRRVIKKHPTVIGGKPRQQLESNTRMPYEIKKPRWSI